MKADYTHLQVILDRTGSMESIRDDIIGGFNSFLEQQRHLPGQTTLTLVQFDSQDPYEILHHWRLIEQVPPLTTKTYVPRASTPLYDCLGQGIEHLSEDLSGIPEPERPEQVLMVIITDGKENASCRYSRRQVQQMVQQKKAQGWQFVFLSADLDAILDAEVDGVAYDSSLAFDKTGAGVDMAYRALSEEVRRTKTSADKKVAFSEEARRQQKLEQERSQRRPKSPQSGSSTEKSQGDAPSSENQAEK